MSGPAVDKKSISFADKIRLSGSMKTNFAFCDNTELEILMPVIRTAVTQDVSIGYWENLTL